MINYFLITSITAVFTLIAYIPFIDILYRLKLQKDEEKGRTDILGIANKILPKLHGHKKCTPIGGGILISVIVIFLFLLLNRHFGAYENFNQDRVFLLSLSFILYGLFGLYDDIRKIIPNKNAQKLHIKASHQLLLQLLISGVISYYGVKLGLFTISFLDIFSVTNQLILFIVSTLVITFMVNAVNITDGLDGLGAGSFLITIVALSVVGMFNDHVESLVLFSLLAGAIVGYLYYNIYPARVFNGDTGTFSVGAVLTVYMLSGGLFFLIPFFGFLYLMEGGSSLLQGISRKYFNKKIFHIAPIHHHFEYIGWPETKVTMRFWLLHIFFSVTALALYFSLISVDR